MIILKPFADYDFRRLLAIQQSVHALDDDAETPARAPFWANRVRRSDHKRGRHHMKVGLALPLLALVLATTAAAPTPDTTPPASTPTATSPTPDRGSSSSAHPSTTGSSDTGTESTPARTSGGVQTGLASTRASGPGDLANTGADTGYLIALAAAGLGTGTALCIGIVLFGRWRRGRYSA